MVFQQLFTFLKLAVPLSYMYCKTV